MNYEGTCAKYSEYSDNSDYSRRITTYLFKNI